MGWSAYAVGADPKIRITSLSWFLALLLTACGGGGGGGGGTAATQDTTPTTVVVSGTVATITDSSVTPQALATQVAVVAMDEHGSVADSATTSGTFSLSLSTGHDYVIVFRDGSVTGPALATLVVDATASGRGTFSLRQGAPDVDLGTITLHRISHRAVSSRTLSDRLPATATQTTDTDGDLIPDTMDRDDDNDGVADASDCAPFDPAKQLLLANSATCVANDSDDDNDGVTDTTDCAPLDPAKQIVLADGTTCVADDADDDNDGVADASDCAPLDSAKQILLADGTTCAVNDGDDDNDGVPDVSDAFPRDPSEALDSDGDGIGNNADPDDDGDGTLDISDCAPLDPARQVLVNGTCVAQGGTSSISGTLLVSTVGQPGETAVTEVEPNDTALTAQFLGPLTTDISYRTTGSLPFADPQDVFWLTESVAQRVTVTLTHGAGVDFDLEVYDVAADGTLTSLGTSTSVTSPDEVIYDTPTPLPGDSYVTAVVVVPWSGTGDYELAIQAANSTGPAAVAAAGKGERRPVATAGSTRPPRPIKEVWDLSDLDAVPGELLVKLRPGPTGMVQTMAVTGWKGLTPCGVVTGVATLLCDEGSATVQAATLSQADLQAAQRRTVGQLLHLRADPRVEEAIPNYILHPSTVPNDPLYNLQWHYPMIGLPEAWDTTTGDPNVIVAVLDTGITAHPDFAGRVIGGYDFVSNLGKSRDGDGIDPDPTDPGDLRGQDNGGLGSSWHGTHVAGTIGATTNNGTGVAGIDWNCRIMPVRVLGRGGGTITDILEGIKYAAGLPNSSGTVPPQRADIINMSLGALDPDGSFVSFAQPVINQAREAGVLIVAAAGNESTSVPSFPAAARGVISVSAVDMTRSLAWYSSFGSTIDIAAPGGNTGADVNGDGESDGVLSTLVSNVNGGFNYQPDQGTSMAAPHVAGVAALVLAANPALTVTQLENLLLDTATDLGAPGRDDLYGHGLVNAAAAVQQAANGIPSATLDVSPAVLNFGASETHLEIGLTNTGLATITVHNPTVTTTDGNAWLSASLSPTTVTPVVVQADRTGLPVGRYAGRVTIDSTGGTRVVEVSLEVAATSGPPDVGTVFVRLVDPTGAVVEEIQATRADGYAYNFADVASGSYTLLASTDSDSDGVLCEVDDFCGAYPVLNEPVAIDVVAGATVTGHDFALAFQGNGVGAPAPPPLVDPEIALLTPLLGEWSFSFTIITTFTDRYALESIDPSGGDPIIVGRDEYGGSVVADTVTDSILGYTYSLYDPGSLIDALYLFDLDPGGNMVSGEYWQIDAATGELPPWPYAMTGVRLPLGTLSVTAMSAATAQEAAAVRAAARATGTPVEASHRQAVQQLYDTVRGVR